MLASSKLEHLANEILLDIFDYLQAIDVISAFSMLNHRLEFLIVKYRMHVDLSTNVSLADFSAYCSNLFVQYASSVHSIRLSNIETCGGIQLFLDHFPSIEQIFPHLSTMSFGEPTEDEFKQIVQFKQLTSISVKFNKHNEPQIPIGLVFTMPNLITCILSYDDVLPVGKLRSNASLRRLVLDGFFLNDLHSLFLFYPLLEHLSIRRLLVNFRGFLPPFPGPISTLKTLQLTCFYTVRFEYIAYLLSFFPGLRRFTLTAIGTDFLQADQWLVAISPLEHLRVLTLDLKAIIGTLTEDLTCSFQKGFWRQWRVAVDYSQDNRKLHLFTAPYGRTSFISTVHCLPVLAAPRSAFSAVTDLYLKTNMPMKTSLERDYSNVRALQIYQNTVVPVDHLALLQRLQLMLNLFKLVHLELFICLPPSTFLALIEQMPCLRFFKTDYNVLLALTDRLRDEAICSQLHRKLEKLVLRRDPLLIDQDDRFLEVFSELKHLQINLASIRDSRHIASKFVKRMGRLRTLQIRLVNTNEQMSKPQWQGMINGSSYEIAERYIKIWK